MTNNLSREILTKNLVNFKRWVEVKDEKFLILCGFTKNMIYRGGGGGHTKNYYIGVIV